MWVGGVGVRGHVPSDAHHEGELRLGWHVVVVVSFRLAQQAHLVALDDAVLTHVLLRSLEDQRLLRRRCLTTETHAAGSIPSLIGHPIIPDNR